MTRITTELERRNDRSVAFATGAFNVRDLGGLATGSGGRVRRGCVYRADGLHRLPVAEVERLAAMGVRTVVDLRTTGELAKDASICADGILVVHLPVLREVWTDGILTSGDSLAGWMRDNRPEAAAAMAREPSAIASCPAEVMHSVLHHIRTRWVSIGGYLKSIGVSDETISSVRSGLA